MIAIICPVGYLDRWGYQYHAPFCLRTMADWADRVYVPVSCEGADLSAIAGIPGVEIVNNPDTWFIKGRFDYRRIIASQNALLDHARGKGHRVVMLMSITTYIPDCAIAALTAKAVRLSEDGAGFAWVYRRDQVGRWLTHTCVKLPIMLNTAGGWRWSEEADTITDGITSERQSYGFFPDCNTEAIVDAPLELTEPDLAGKIEFVRNYEDLRQYKRPPYTFAYRLDYYRKKIGTRPVDRMIDNAISRGIQPDFISNLVVEQ